MVAAGALVLRRVGRVEVFGDSMLPTLASGDRLIVLRTPRARRGHLVAVPDPRQPNRTVIKRVAAISGDTVTVLGDNPSASTDSRAFGAVSRTTIRGRAVFRYFPAHRRAVL
jgi:nickel-type superoxide dismutase maturation protease